MQNDELAGVRRQAERDFTIVESSGAWATWTGQEADVPPWWVAGSEYVFALLEAKTRLFWLQLSSTNLRLKWDVEVRRECEEIYLVNLFPYEKAVSDDIDLSYRMFRFTCYVERTIRPKLASLLLERWSGGDIAQSAGSLPEHCAIRAEIQSELETDQSEKAGGEDHEVLRRKRLLQEYMSAKAINTKAAIYNSSNSGIHKPEFYKWINGVLPRESKTTINFERFLRSKQNPIRRKPCH